MKRTQQLAIAALVAALSLPASAQDGRWGKRGDRGGDRHQAQQQQPAPDRAFQQSSGGQQPDRNKQNNQNNRQSDARPERSDRNEPRMHGPGPHAGDWLRRFGSLPADQQQKQLESDPNFKKLPSDRQQKLRNRLQNFNSMPPDRRQRILNRMEVWEHMTPEQQSRAQGMFKQFRAMPPERRQAVTQTLRRLREMPSDQRQQMFQSNEFRNSFNDQEQNMIKGLSDLGDQEDEQGPGGEF